MLGAGEFVSATRRLAGELEDTLEAATETIADAIIEAGNPPRVSGTLARSQRVELVPGGATIVASAPYAGVIRFGWPARNITANDWLSPAVARAETVALDAAAAAVTDTLNTLY